jgi:hypothetical protein
MQFRDLNATSHIGSDGVRREGCSNNDRALTALRSLKVFAIGQGGQDSIDQEDADTIISDFVADLMHLCRFNHIDFDDVCRRARNNHDAEVVVSLEDESL